jgi:hypothetical protein
MVALFWMPLLPIPTAIAAVSLLFLSGVVTINFLFPKA